MKYFIFIFLLLFQSLLAVNFTIDYTYDTSGFFGDPNNSNDGRKERRDAIEAVADLFSELIQDELLTIDPSEFTSVSWTPRITDPATGNQINLMNNLVVPANEVIIYVGARDLGGNILGRAGPNTGFSASGFQSWFDRIRGRGQGGAVSANLSERTDFALWSGTIAFDTDDPNAASSRNWNFSLTQNLTGSEFVAVAIHEFCHVLGIGIVPSWDNLIASNGDFLGEATMRSLGTLSVDSDGGHFSTTVPNSVSFGSFDVVHGSVQPVIMRAALSDNGTRFNVVSDLDLAALIDIGWEVRVPTSIESFSLQSSSAVLVWPTSSFVNYQVMRATDLSDFTQQGIVIEGDGSLELWNDSNTPTDRGFYRIQATYIFSTVSSVTEPATLLEEIQLKQNYGQYESPQSPHISCQECDQCHGQ